MSDASSPAAAGNATPPPATPAEATPQSLFDKMGAALPIALTALATVFAGMSTGALQQAMYWKSQAAQDQSRGANQWSLAGFKRDRALIMEATAAQLRAASAYKAPTFTPEDGKSRSSNGKEIVSAEAAKKAIDWLAGNGPPVARLPVPEDEKITQLTRAIREREPEKKILQLAGRIEQDSMNDAIDAAEKANEQIDVEWDPIVKAAKAIIQEASKKASKSKGGNDSVRGAAAALERAMALQAAGFDLEERRYRAESRLNQQIGYLYDARVRVSSAESDKHRDKSQKLFLCMLAAQVGATVASLALARKQQRGALWAIAGVAGLVAIGYGGYVFLGTM